jgi:hypothetical protein
LIEVLGHSPQAAPIVVQNPEPGLRELLTTERDRMTEKIDFLIQNREFLTRYIEGIDRAPTQDQSLHTD